MEKKRMGRPPIEPTDDDRMMAERLSGIGVGHRQIATLVAGGIDVTTLEKHFRAELDRGKAKAHGKIAGKFFQKCMDGDTASLIFYLKTQMGWKEKQEVELSGEVKGFIVVPAKADLEPDA